MALFRSITATSDLPAVGAGRESGTFDFKGSADPTNDRELAKDAAAFANALGGVVLVGAEEDGQTGALKRYRPMPEPVAETLKAAYESAVRNKCHPPPVVEVVRIAAPNAQGGYVVAVNVYATPLGPVGVRWGPDRVTPSWAFPLRTTTHTHFMTPTELSMLMVPEIRRVAILLDRIPPGERSGMTLLHIQPNGMALTFTADFLGVDAGLTTATFKSPVGTPADGTIPLDRITSVWRLDDRRWSIAVDGFIAGNSTNQGFSFRPR
jgi:hypothetical protein